MEENKSEIVIFKTADDKVSIDVKKFVRSVPGSCFNNEHLVCTSREFWHFFYLRLLELHFAKTQENVRFENKVCPCFVLKNLKL